MSKWRVAAAAVVAFLAVSALLTYWPGVRSSSPKRPLPPQARTR